LFQRLAFGSSTRNVEATAAFPESNPFSHVTNGRNNAINVVITNKEDVEIELKKIFGAFKDANTERFIRNTTAASYQAPIPAKQKKTIPYAFYSEFKPQDMRLELWVEYTAGGQPYTIQAFDSVVSIVEPPASIFDPQLILTYLIILAVFGGVGYLAYASYFPQKKKRTIPTPPAPVETKATTTSGYQEEWIPEHHLKTRVRKARGTSAMSSGDESGQEKLSKNKKK